MNVAHETLAAYLESRRRQVEAALDRVVAAVAAPAVLADALRYALMGGGKRLRPCLTLAVAEALAIRDARDVDASLAMAMPAACAVEMIHSYSLVHDDLPAMDDDALRRGRPTSHIVYGEGLAILAGDGLLTDAFALLVRADAASGAPVAAPADRLRAVAVLAEAAGSAGMVGGQAIDLAAAGRVTGATPVLDGHALEDMHLRKTGALIRAACTLGGIMTGAAGHDIAAIDDYARALGLAFQIIDDVLDVEGSNAALGKTAGKDAASGKPTFPALYGVAGSRARASASVDRAIAAVSGVHLGGRLVEIAQWSLARTH